jgi:CHAD domain-containing protein/CYTH domain-containing protein
MTKPAPLTTLRAEEGARRVLLRRLKAAERAAVRLRRDARDVEALHDFRTSIRRFRSVERSFRPWLKALKPALRRRVAALADATNAARDAEVLIERLTPHVAFLPPAHRPAADALLAAWADRKARAYRAVRREVLASFQKLATDLAAKLKRPPRKKGSPSDPPPLSFADAAAEAARDLALRLNDAASRLGGPQEVELAHEARIAAKRLRYVVETCLKERPAAAPHAERAKTLQEVLGEMRDWQLVEAELRAEPPQPAPGAAPAASREDLGPLAALVTARIGETFARLKDLLGPESAAAPVPLAAALAGRPKPVSGDAEVEIERKYLLTAAPPTALDLPAFDIVQGWLPGVRLKERLRRTRDAEGTERHYRTIKFGSGVKRTEIEEETTPELFKLLWRATKGRRVRKFRHVVPAGELKWEIDVFRDHDLVIAEIELPAEDAPVEFPDWLRPYLVREVTGDPAYSNSNLAR